MSDYDAILACHDAIRPSVRVPHPANADIGVECYHCSDELGVMIEYHGWAVDLIAAGIMTEQQLQPTGKHLRDTEGYAISITRGWRAKDGKPKRWCRVLRRRPLPAAHALPGATAAIEAWERHEIWQEHRYKIVAQRHGSAPMERPKRSEEPEPVIPAAVQLQVQQMLQRLMSGRAQP